jgi:hypothetical protein
MTFVNGYRCTLLHYVEELQEAAEKNNHKIFVDGYQKYLPDMVYFGIDASDEWFDRTKQIPHYLNFDVPDLPNLPDDFNKSFETICLERATELLSTGKYINLLWSGGIDSTVALAAIHAIIQDRKQFNVTCTYNSVYESGPLFDMFIKHNYAFDIKIQPLTYSQIEPNLPFDILLNGQLGDNLCSPGGMSSDMTPQIKQRRYKDISSMDIPWQDTFTDDFVKFCFLRNFYVNHIEILKVSMVLHFEIKTNN